jgi:hypothetical protein
MQTFAHVAYMSQIQLKNTENMVVELKGKPTK